MNDDDLKIDDPPPHPSNIPISGSRRGMTNIDLEAADLDEDGVVGAAEFVFYKLKEMGKIDQKDIAGIMEEFEQLDYDESGNLTNSDIISQIQSSGSTRRTTKNDLEAADLDEDGVVG
ncbi:unnamed protein product [Arabis nemorensis]|uniref:EF-hand domain-containing protein n=1 Tax=Arabis nemorensis TaxID=586526 RepID=A0A565B2N2_9BRAS|nr:unnamed protein product [Arabis nemorensis]